MSEIKDATSEPNAYQEGLLRALYLITGVELKNERGDRAAVDVMEDAIQAIRMELHGVSCG